jgi:hypothetical protein
MIDFRLARDRRRFFIQRGLRKRTGTGRGSDLEGLMALPRTEVAVNPRDILGDIPYCVVGGVATRAYMPERVTRDIDVLVNADDFDAAEERLREAGYTAIKKHDDLFFANSHLGLFGRVWEKSGVRVDLIASRQPWVHEALAIEAYDQTGLRVIALPYLVLMKLDASRGQDQADAERMLGRLTDDQVEEIARIVDRYSGDPQAAQDVAQYALLGRLEYEANPE